MKRCIITVGVSGSGKTFWANHFIKEAAIGGETWYNLNRDDIRARVFSYKTKKSTFKWSEWKWKWEKDVSQIWNDIADELLVDQNINGVIVSDTNLNPTYRERIEKKFTDAGFEVEFKHFPVEYEVAVQRDLVRDNSVGSSVIAEQIERYWEQFSERYVPNTSLPKAVIVDIDGTLAHHDGKRDIYDFSKIHMDRPDDMVVAVVRGLHATHKIIVTSGREDAARQETWDWLVNNLGFEPDALLMRTTHDFRKDCVVKKEIFFRDIEPNYHVVGVIDDRPQVVRMWHSLGLRVLACGIQHKEF